MSSKMSNELAASLGLDDFEAELNGVRQEVKQEPRQQEFKGEAPTQVAVMETFDLGEELEDEADGGSGIVLSPMEIPKRETKVAILDDDPTDFATDLQHVRDVTYATQEMALSMMQESAKLAAETGNTKVFDTFNNMAKTVRELNQDLISFHESEKAIGQRNVAKSSVPGGAAPEGGVTVNIGTNSASLLKMLEEEEKNMKSDLDGEIEDADIK